VRASWAAVCALGALWALWVPCAIGCFRPAPQQGVPCSMTLECPNGQQCDTNAVPPTCVDQLPDAPPPPPVCTPGSCGADAPICDGQTGACRGCRADAECGGADACTEYDGLCHNEGSVIFVAANGSDNNKCNHGQPCKTFNAAFNVLAADRRIILVAPGAYMSTGSTLVSVGDQNGRIVISGNDTDPSDTTFSSLGNGTVNPVTVSVNNGTDVVLEGVTVSGGANDGVRASGALLLSHVALANNAQRGIASVNNASLHVYDSQIADNKDLGISTQEGALEVLRTTIARNHDGGIVTNKTAFTIEGSIVANNGALFSGNGGIRLTNLNGLPQRIAFVTVANNVAANLVSGIQAEGTVAIENSIVVENNDTNADQIDAGCTATFSMFSGTDTPFGQGNIASGQADFRDAANDDFHLVSTSKAVDAADPSATGLVDIDGDPRPLGARCDMGADELR
jgi:hypothetical protein